jgi:DNA-directed RNA polymerase subunit RPC12/RpoP
MSFWKKLFGGETKPKPAARDELMPSVREAVKHLKSIGDDERASIQQTLDEMRGRGKASSNERQAVPCTECGDWRGMTPFFKCAKCSTEVTFSLNDVRQYSQLHVRCPKCQSIVHIPQSVICKKCGNGLQNGWQEKIVVKR